MTFPYVPERGSNRSNEPIAIVGIGCRLPGGITKSSDLWDFLCQKRSAVRPFDSSRLNLSGFYHPDFQRPGSFHTESACLLDEDPRLFDHSFFGMNTTQVMSMDPSQRKMLEVSYEAFESAGEPWETFSGSKTGVFVGSMNSDHSIMQAYDMDFTLPHASTGGSTSILSNRINHVFNLRGPSLTVDTACSSSMYALHLAVNAIRNGDCDAAIVGGSNLIMAPEMQILTVKLGALSPTSTCHTFDSSADGYGRAEGFGALYLMRESDAKKGGYPIRALIKGTAINSNGRTAGISHPSADGQEAVIRQAYKNAGLQTQDTTYCECHGTGTPVGDPLEVSALGRVFQSDRLDSAPLLIGSVKTNLGHSEAASGIVGIIKTVLALEKGMIPATIGIQHLNPNIDFEGARVEVVTELTTWPQDTLRRASVNSFGYGGANAHCVLEYEPVHDNYRVPGSEHPRRLFLLPFSAHNPDSLSANIFATHDMVRQLPLADVAYTLSARRSKFLHKAFSILDTKHTKEDITLSHTLQTNSASSKTPSIAFVFTGQGAQWQGMGAELMDFMHFNASISHQDDVLQSLSNAPTWKLEDVFTGRTQLDVQEAEVSQTLCSALQIALVDLLQSWGITPEACVGHSSGEIAAAYAAGYISAAEAIATAYCRGISIVTNTRKGAMLAVGLSIEATLQLFEGMESEVKIAAVNSPTSVTLSGDTDCINQLYEQLNSRDCFARKLWTGGNAYHSHHMNEVGREYGHMLLRVTSEHERTKQWISSKRCNKTRWISSVTPDKSEFFQGPSSAYWRSNLQLPVQFSKALGNLSSQGHLSPDIYIEIGPHSVLQSPIKEILAQAAEAGAGKPAIYLSTLTRNENGMQSILTLCGNLFCLNAAVDLGAANAHETLENGTIRRLPGSVCTDLPPYQYKYGSPVYHENRVFREIKQRKHLRHDILGVMQAGCAKERPSWRNILRIKDVPWLMDHELLPDIVFPGAGYVALAIEAVAQFLNKDPTVSMFKLRNISIKTAMRIPKDDMGLEIVLNMSASVHSSCWYQFNIASVYGTTWTEHASGLISMPSSHERSLPDLASHMDPRFVEASDWYRKFSQAGLGYGPSFQGLSDVLSDPSKNIASAKVCLNTTKGMFTGPESQYVVHPASLDICFQLAIIAAHGGHTATFKTAYIPVLIDEMTVWPTAGHQAFGRAVADARFKGLRGAHARIQLFAEDKRPMVEITNLRSVQYVGGNAAEQNLAGLPNPYTRLVWKPDITTLSCAQARSLFPATVPAVTISHTLNLMDMTSAYMIAELAEKYSGHRPENADLRRFLLWIKRTAASEEPLIQKACSMTTVDRVNALEQVRVTLENIVDVKHTMHIFDNIPDILAGRSTGVEVALQDDHLTELYTSGIGISAAYPQLGRVLDLLSHKNPSMKILEVGSGTGCATMIALNTLGGAEAEEKRYGEYVFTDISTRFLQPAQDRFVDFKDVAYRTLDFNRSPLSQGFTCDFDLIIASECLHTAEDVPQALRHVRELLKVGGHLLMLETTRTILGHGLAYGTFPSYWPMEEDKDSPFLTTEEWQRSLEQSGFSGIDLELDDYPAPFSIASTIMATALSTMSVDITVPASTVYIVSPSTEDLFGRTLASGLLDVGSRPIITSLDDADLPSGSRVILVTNIDAQPLIDNNESHFLRLKEVVSKSSSILFLTTGDIIRGTNPKASVVTGLVRMLTTEDSSSRYGVFHLEGDCDISDKALLKLVVDRESRLYAGDFEREIAVHNGVANICRLIVDRDLNERYRSIYSSPPAMIRRALHSAEPMSIGFETPGLLSTMYFKRDDTFDDPIPESWIEVQTKAIGLNWKDVAACSGKLDINYMSLEYAGVVTACGPRAQEFQIGDRVYGLALKKFGNVLRISARHARLMRPVDGFVEAATMPIVFCTAVYALLHLARLRRGESILIQSAAGGLGLAAIQIGRSVGAEIYVTTGTDTKTSYLAEKCDIDRMRIFSSRGVSDVGKMMQATKQKGFDVILSSSNGNTMQEVARCIARRGRFIDVGRVDVQNNNVMTMDFFERNASFSSFDLGKIIEEEPEFAAQLLEEVDSLLKRGVIRPCLSIKTFEVSELDQALLYFSKGTHVGKLVIDYDNEASNVPIVDAPPTVRLDRDAVYVLVGGLGGLGRSIVRWMVGKGARNLAVCNRSGNPPPEALVMIEELTQQGVFVRVLKCDVANKKEVDTAICAAADVGPVKGILHAAVVLQDRVFSTLTHSQWEQGLYAKVHGTINLHEAANDMKLPLEFFIMTSSFEAVMALPTQAAYCAANCFQDAFARYRNSLGLPGCAIAFGLITEIGEMGQREKTRKMIYRNGLYRTGELGFLRLLEGAFLKSPQPTSDLFQFDPLAKAQITTCLEPAELAKMAGKHYDTETQLPRWHSDRKFSHLLQSMNDHLSAGETRTTPKEAIIPAITSDVDTAIRERSLQDATDIVTAAIIERTASLLFVPLQSIEASKSVAHYGVDSLIAVELRNWFTMLFQDTVPLLKLLDESVSIRELGAMVAEKRSIIIKLQ